MMQADDVYAGSQSFYRLLKAVQDVLGKQYYLPVHQGRAAKHYFERLCEEWSIIPMNYHFTTAMAHITQYAEKSPNCFTTKPIL
jgi:tryptophanase